MQFENISIKNIISESVAKNGIIIDVRDKEEFAKGHIPMAMNVSLEELQQNRFSLPRSRVLILYCETGASSLMAARILSSKGYRVINTVGGLREYEKALTCKH